MQTHARSQSMTPDFTRGKLAYQTSYKREYAPKRTITMAESPPFGQRFLIGSPFQLNDPIGNSLYTMDFTKENDVRRDIFPRPNTNRANRPHPPKQFPYWPRSESLCDLSAPEETKQALRNQLNSTYQVDFNGK